VTPALFVFLMVQLTGTVVPLVTDEKAVQVSLFPEETLDAGRFVDGSAHITAVIDVAFCMVTLAVAVKVDCDCDVAVIVTTLFVGTVAGAVYKPPLVIAPTSVPLTDQFTRVLLALRTVAVHCAVPSTVTLDPVPCVETHEAVMAGVTVVVLLDPQELRIASAAASPKSK
jgi:hypothetical protein